MENTEVKVDEIQNEEHTTNNNQEIDYKSLYEEKANKVDELEWLIQKHKEKKKKEPVWNNDIDIDSLLEKKLAEKDFYASNPEMSEYKEQITEFTSKGLTHEQAKRLVIDSDPTIQNRMNSQSSNFTNTDWVWYETEVYTMEKLAEIWKANPSKYAQLMSDYKSGKIKVK